MAAAEGSGEPDGAVDGSGELPAPSHELFTSTEVLDRMAMQKMLAGIYLTRVLVRSKSRLDRDFQGSDSGELDPNPRFALDDLRPGIRTAGEGVEGALLRERPRLLPELRAFRQCPFAPDAGPPTGRRSWA